MRANGQRSPVRSSKQIVTLLVSLATVAIVAIIGGSSSANAASEYALLDQPDWAPPSWIFGPMWAALYTMMAVSAWLVWQTKRGGRVLAIAIYGLQLVVNCIWSPLFFGAQLRGWALADIVLLDVLVATTIILFVRVHRAAAMIMIPYLAWILFATALNYTVWSMNS
ncbi:tryptophan-rich sensory protein [Tsukamurella serpentis]